jgi:hypothetical protein
VETLRELPREIEDLLYDPQTSGGLLIALPESDAAQFTGGYRDRPRAAARGESHPLIYETAQPHHRRPGRGIRRRSARAGRANRPRVNFYKVGLELYTAAGMDFVRELLGKGKAGLPRPEDVRHSRDREAAPWPGGAHRRALPHRARGGFGDARRRGAAREAV